MKQIGNFRIYVHYTSNTNTMNSLTTISGTRIIDIIMITKIYLRITLKLLFILKSDH